MAYQSLYRRYRPRRFGEVRGQEHVMLALRNSVRDGRVGHAYLFSGPRGTGKTSSARILAKALNCEHLEDGEPDGTCESCRAIDAGTSYDVQELDAASNNGVEAVRDLVARATLGSPGRTKVYILDEVHMLSAAASAALLKTLEEPPSHVVFVLATTDPHKVLDTIRSRTQHFEFHLLPAEVLREHVAWVVQDAGLDVGDDAIEHVLRVGGGSARDTLSALDQVAAAGGAVTPLDRLDDLLDAVADADTGRALAAVAAAVARGRDPRVLAEQLLAHLRDVFLLRMKAELDHLPDEQIERTRAWAERLGDRATTRALEAVGAALLEMRQAPDPRIPLEVALVRLTLPTSDASIEGLVARVEHLEHLVAARATLGPPGAPAPDTIRAPRPDAPPSSAPAPGPSSEPVAGSSSDAPASVPATRPAGTRPADGARAELAARRAGSAPAPRPAAAPAPPRAAPPARPRPAGAAVSGGGEPAAGPPAGPPAGAAGSDAAVATSGKGPTATAAVVPPAARPPSPPGALTSHDDVESAWVDAVLPQLGGLARAMYSAGHVIEARGDDVVVALPNEAHRLKCEQRKADVERVLSEHLGRPIRLRLVLDDAGPDAPSGGGGAGPPGGSASISGPDEDLGSDVHALEDAPPAVEGVDALTAAFPGAELIDHDE